MKSSEIKDLWKKKNLDKREERIMEYYVGSYGI